MPAFIPSVPPKPAAPAIVHADLGEHDVRTRIIVEFTSRYGTVFRNEEVEVLGGFTDPANQGHMAKAAETSFRRMAAFFVQKANQFIGIALKDKAKPEASNTKPPAVLPPVSSSPVMQKLIGGTAGEPKTVGILPQAVKPGAVAPNKN